MSYNLPNSLCGPNASGDVTFASLGSNFALNTGEGFVGYKSNLGIYYQNAFVIDTTSTVPTVFSNNGTPSFSINSGGTLAVFGDVTKGTLNFGDTNAVNFGNPFVPLGTAYFKEIKVGATNANSASLVTDQNYHLQLRSGSNDVKFSVANTYTDINNYERLEIGWDTDEVQIKSVAAGTGTQRVLNIGTPNISMSFVDGSSIQVDEDFYCTGATNNVLNLGTQSRRWGNTYSRTVRTDTIYNTSIQTHTATGSVNQYETMNLVDATSGAVTLTLPATLNQTGVQMTFKKIDASVNTVTIDADGSETIDGALTQTLSSQWEKITLVSDGSNWFTI